MSDRPEFKAAFAYQDNVLELPVTDLDAAARWYSAAFGMSEVARHEGPPSRVVLERDGVRIGFALTGKDPEQDGAAILVANIHGLKDELESRELKIGNWRIDEREGKKFQVFFVVAPDGLCFYFHELI